MTQHIGVLYTGGTIGMAESGRGLVPARLEGETLRRILGESAPATTVFSLDEPIDSADAVPADWARITSMITERWQSFDAFVVLHGTDTLAFSASAVSLLLGGIDKPVVFTGAQVPLGRLAGDGEGNLAAAVAVAAQGAAQACLNEVAIAFGRKVLRGNRAKKLNADSFDAFDSPNHVPLALIGPKIVWDEAALLPPSAPSFGPLPAFREGAVVSWRFTPGHSLAAFERLLDCGAEAVILEYYGSGTGPSRDPRLTRLIDAAAGRGLLFAAVSQCPTGTVDQGIYASGQALADLGVIGCRDMTFEAAYAKAQIVIATETDPAARRQAFRRIWRGESIGLLAAR